MTCAEFLALLPGHLKGEALPGEARLHLDGCPACRREAEELTALWGALGTLETPLPGPGLRARVLRRPSRMPYVLATAAALLLLVGGIALGRTLSGIPQGGLQSSARSRGSLVLVGSPSPTERIKGLALLGAGDGNLTETLLALIERDPDTQVRLAAVDSLYLAAGDPGLRARLGTVLLRQDRPEVQAALVDLLVGLRERAALEALRRLAEQGRLDPGVRSRLRTGIKQLEAMPL